MGIFFLVVALLVAAILLSRLTWWPAWGERRSVKHHEQAMDVLRSFASRRTGSESAGGVGAAEHPSSSPADAIGPATVSDEIPPAAPAGAHYDLVRLLREERPSEKLPAPPAPAATASPVAPGPDPIEEVASAGVGDAGAVPASDEKATVKPSFVFFAEDGGDDLVAPGPALPSPPSVEEVTRPSRSRAGALLLAMSHVDRPRLGLAVGLGTVIITATVLGILVGLMSTSNSQRVRQVAAPPTTIAPAPVPAPAPPTTSTEVPTATTILPAQTSPTTPTTTIQRHVDTGVVSPPPTTTPTSPPTTATTSPPTTSTPASVVSSPPSTTSPPPTTSPPRTTTTTTSTTSPTTTTTEP